MSEYDGGAEETIYSLIHHQALAKIPQHYQLDGWVQPRPPFSFDRLLAWAYFVEHNIRAAIESNTLPKEWAADYWPPHNIRFGILLGYPGEAIAGGCWMQPTQRTII